MNLSRIEAFSDGVFAIIITIMVLEIGIPHGGTLEAVLEIAPTFFAYVLSFVILAIYWNNHHHLLHAAKHATTKVMWANMHLLFWLTLIPFATAWLGEHHTEAFPVAAYAILNLAAGFAYQLLQRAILKQHSPASPIKTNIGRDRKGMLSLAGYMLAAFLAFASVWIAYSLFALIAIIWFIPDRRLVSE